MPKKTPNCPECQNVMVPLFRKAGRGREGFRRAAELFYCPEHDFAGRRRGAVTRFLGPDA